MNRFKNDINKLNLGWKEKKTHVCLNKSKKNYLFLNFLVKQGFVESFVYLIDKNVYKVKLKNFLNGKGVLGCSTKMLNSKKNLTCRKLTKFENGHFIILSTSQGFMSQQEALGLKIGGKFTCYVMFR